MGVLDLRLDPRHHRPLLVGRQGGAEAGAQSLQRTAHLPRLVLGLGAVADVIVEVRPAMLTPPVRVQQQERRAGPVARTGNRLRRQPEGFLDIVAVAVQRLHAVRTRDIAQRSIGLALPQVGVDRVEVVLAHEDHGQSVERSEIGALVEHAFLDGGVAEEGRRDLAVAQALVCKRASDREGDGARYDGDAGHHALIDVHEMHGAAAPADAACGFAADLGQHAPEVAILGEVVGVAAMRAVDLVGLRQGLAYADGRRLLADRKMHRAAHFPFAVVIGDCLLHQPNAQHLAVELEQPLFGQGRHDLGPALQGGLAHAAPQIALRMPTGIFFLFPLFGGWLDIPSR